MSDATAISWCDSTFNPWIGCTKVGPGCDHCYAERDMDKRLGHARWGAGEQRVRTTTGNWNKPRQWNSRAFAACGMCSWRGERVKLIGAACPGCGSYEIKPARRRVFCASLADVFDNEVDPTWREELFDLIAATPNLDWLLLTKRIGNVARMLAEVGIDERLEHAWLGATMVTQDELERDLLKLLAMRPMFRVLFLSIEPMLGPIVIPSNLLQVLDWVIVGGESGPGARPMNPDWPRRLRRQCEADGVAFHFKQWGEWLPGENYDLNALAQWQDGCTGQHPSTIAPRRGGEWRHFTRAGDPGAFTLRVGKKASGRRLDGLEHNGFPA